MAVAATARAARAIMMMAALPVHLISIVWTVRCRWGPCDEWTLTNQTRISIFLWKAMMKRSEMTSPTTSTTGARQA